MDMDHDRQMLIRAELSDLLEALRLTSFDTNPLQFLVRLEAIRKTAVVHQFSTVAEIAGVFEATMQRVIDHGGGDSVVSSFSIERCVLFAVSGGLSREMMRAFPAVSALTASATSTPSTTPIDDSGSAASRPAYTGQVLVRAAPARAAERATNSTADTEASKCAAASMRR